MTTVRFAEIRDVVPIMDMALQFHKNTSYGALFKLDEDLTAKAVIDLITGTQGEVILAEDDGRVVGMIGLILHDHWLSGDKVAAELFWWCDVPGQGVGTKLRLAAEIWAHAAGCTKITMIVPSGAVALWKNLDQAGYRTVEETMMKDLNAPHH